MKKDALVIQSGLKAWNNVHERVTSPEFDYGAWWTMTGDLYEFPRWSVSWIENTGEIYAWNTVEGRYIVLGNAGIGREGEARAEFFLEGWGNPDSGIYHNLTALAAQIAERQAQPTPQSFLKALTRTL